MIQSYMTWLHGACGGRRLEVPACWFKKIVGKLFLECVDIVSLGDLDIYRSICELLNTQPYYCWNDVSRAEGH